MEINDQIDASVNPFQCSKCAKIFKTRSQLISHYKRKTPCGPKKIEADTNQLVDAEIKSHSSNDTVVPARHEPDIISKNDNISVDSEKEHKSNVNQEFSQNAQYDSLNDFEYKIDPTPILSNKEPEYDSDFNNEEKTRISVKICKRLNSQCIYCFSKYFKKETGKEHQKECFCAYVNSLINYHQKPPNNIKDLHHIFDVFRAYYTESTIIFRKLSNESHKLKIKYADKKFTNKKLRKRLIMTEGVINSAGIPMPYSRSPKSLDSSRYDKI